MWKKLFLKKIGWTKCQTDIRNKSDNFYTGLDNVRCPTVILSTDGKSSTWLPVTGVPPRSIFGSLIFLICMNDLSNNLTSPTKRFVDNTSLFSVVNDVNLSDFYLNSDFKKILE